MISVRFARRNDLETAQRLLTAQLVEHHLPAGAEGMRRALAMVGDSTEASRVWLLLAERDQEAVGVCLANLIVSVEKAGLVLWIEELYVAPEARRQGVATALIESLKASARRCDVRLLELEVVRTQHGAFALYDRLGFSRIDRQLMGLDL